jgi:hypothetical protein
MESGDSLLDSADPGAALLEFLTIAAAQRQQRDVSFLLQAGAEDDRIVEVRRRLNATIAALVEQAREAGALRSDVTPTDIGLLMCAPVYVAAHAADGQPELWRRYLGIIFDGLRPDGAHPLPLASPAMD